jgi:predicted DCC family thiol-disulfide oxidoreductase YuxK
MKKLTILYDAGCGFCISCRHWMEEQPTLIELDFVAAHSAEAARRFPELEQAKEEELVVVSDEGGIYRGARAFIMCLYALDEYREWSLRLSRPGLLPLARNAFALVSRSRKGLSRLLCLAPEEKVSAVLREVSATSCPTRRPAASRGLSALEPRPPGITR